MDIFVQTNSIFKSRTYILFVPDRDTVWLVDCGDVNGILQWLDRNKKILSGVFLTHTHFDHIYGLNELKRVCPQCMVYVSVIGKQGLYDPKLNMSRYHPTVPIFMYEHEDVLVLKETETIVLWPGVTLEVFETPGHDPACLVYKAGHYFFTGDSYIPGISTVTSFPGSNKLDTKISLERILKIKEKYNLTVCPGHYIKQP
jgi:glyoxylase-like metal-dependent hydrolase (beta-lactamase superfamily II)